MDMKQPAPHNAIDDNRHGLIGRPLDRVEGHLKVTGQAAYAHDVQEGEDGAEPSARAAHGVVVEAAISKGRIAAIDSVAAERAPGVLLVMTHLNAPKQAAWGPLDAEDRFARASPQLGSDRVRYRGEAVAFVVAETLEQARAAAMLVDVRYDAEPASHDLAAGAAHAEKPDAAEKMEPDSEVGDFDTAFAKAAASIDATYTTPVHIHAQMEPHAALAYWVGDKVVVHCSAQLLKSAQKALANTLQIDADNVRIVSRYIGGGFGGKLPVFGDVMLSAMAARRLGRPVKTALTRQQMFHFTTHRSGTIQRIRLGADRDGRLVAIGHDVTAHSARFDHFWEPAAMQTRSLYAAPNRSTTHRLVKLDLPMADSTRAPGEAVGLLALEQGMDELAEQLGLDPIELRVRNDAATDPERDVPFSSRQLVECLREGAQRFGWSARDAVPGRRRDGRWLIGMGVASAIRSNYLQPSSCHLRLAADGTLTARMAMTDIGTGSYTVLTQIAAEMLGLAPTQVRMELGDSEFPETPGSGGSWGAASAGSGLFDACATLRGALAHALGIEPSQALFDHGRISGGGKSASLAELAAGAGADGIEATGKIEPGAMGKAYSQQAFGAHFAEVAVDMDTGEVRLRRMLGVFAAGRILNPKTARSQAIGAMIWGVGSALHEDAVVDTRVGAFVNHDLAEYHVPAHADIPAIDAIFLHEVDDKTNPLKIKGVGELGICGAGAAVANAVYNACGARIREYPITLDKVIAAMESQPKAA